MMLAVKRVNSRLRAGLIGKINRSIGVGMFPVEICEIHSLGRYSREVLIGISSAYRTPEMSVRERKN